jgi:hypothetical protein
MGTDPVLLNDATEFTVIDNSGAATNTVLRLFFAEPVGDAAPSITSAMFDGATTDTFTSPSLVGTWNMSVGPAKDLYTFVGCTSCNNSVNVSNIETTLKGVGLASVTSLSVYEVDVNQFFTAKNQFIDVKGTFQLGTVVIPLGDDRTTKKGVTTDNFLDTSWTNTAFVDVRPDGPLTAAVPEPSTWAMMGVGFALLGFAGYRRSLAPRTIA